MKLITSNVLSKVHLNDSTEKTCFEIRGQLAPDGGQLAPNMSLMDLSEMKVFQATPVW